MVYAHELLQKKQEARDARRRAEEEDEEEGGKEGTKKNVSRSRGESRRERERERRLKGEGSVQSEAVTAASVVDVCMKVKVGSRHVKQKANATSITAKGESW